MQKQVKNAFIILIAFFAVLTVLGLFTGALDSLEKADPLLFAFGAGLFILSIVAWLLSWAIMIRSRQSGFGKNLLLGFACVFASLTPIQVGADALRSIKMKEVFGISFTETISASMVVKGIKFLIIALVASIAFLAAFFNPGLSLWVKMALLSGFSVVLIATLLFLLPINQRIGQKIASLFKFLSKHFKPFARIQKYFEGYSLYLKSTPRKTLALVLVLAIVSISLEFAAFIFGFLSAGVLIPIYSALILFSILSIVERTPFLPRGIGAFEAVGLIFLSLDSFTGLSLSPGQIATVIILFDAMRLIIPTIASLVVYGLLFKK